MDQPPRKECIEPNRSDQLQALIDASFEREQELKAENVMLQGALEGLKVGSCSCGTKTHEPEFHKGYCNYKRISAALAATPRRAT
jgi:hypothetical protein